MSYLMPSTMKIILHEGRLQSSLIPLGDTSRQLESPFSFLENAPPGMERGVRSPCSLRPNWARSYVPPEIPLTVRSQNAFFSSAVFIYERGCRI